MKAKILVVDDEKEIRDILRSFFEKEGYEVKEAQCGYDACAFVRREEVDIMILDVGLPGISGLEILKSIRQLGRDIPVIVLTGHNNFETTVEAMRNGAFDFVTKPFKLDELLLKVKTAEILRESKERQQKRLYDARSLIIGKHPLMIELYKTIGIVATTSNDFTVLIEGESGTGKEVIARAIHQLTAKEKPFVTVDCALIPDNILEAELFGYEKGAFTGADRTKPGKFELAKDGIIYLDEIGELQPNLQAKLLRVLQTREFERLGGTLTMKTKARFIAATNRDLEVMVQKGEFREDLFYRLNLIRIRVPPLRERKEDIPLLLEHFLSKSEKILKRPIMISSEAMNILLNYDYPGNVRELEHIVKRAAAFATHGIITIEHLPQNIINRKCMEPQSREEIIKELDKKFILDILERTRWNISNASKLLGIQRQSLHRIIKRYGLEKGKIIKNNFK